jgi:hypothetical protein
MWVPARGRTTLRLPSPEEFLWQYVASTPLRGLVNDAPPDAQTALEAEVAEPCGEWVDDGRLVVDLSLVVTHGRTGGHAE